MSSDGRERREYLLATVLLAFAALASWWALSRPWLTVTESLLGVGEESDPAFAAAQNVVSTSGSSLVPVTAALPVLMLAGIAAVVGSRGWGRRIAGAFIAWVAALELFAIFSAFVLDGIASFAPANAREVTTDVLGPIAALVAAGVGIAAGILVLVRGPRWPALGRSYERRTRQPRDAWEALDEGLDPTVEPDESSGSSQPGDGPSLR